MTGRTSLYALLLFVISPFVFSSSALGQDAAAPVTVQFHNLWVDYDITLDSEYGMLIHISFSVQGMKDQNGEIGFAFENSEGERLYSNHPDYSSTGGELTIYRVVTPAYEDTYYEDLRVFMPYWALTVGPGTNELRIHADLLYQNNNDWTDAHLAFHDFTFTK